MFFVFAFSRLTFKPCIDTNRVVGGLYVDGTDLMATLSHTRSVTVSVPPPGMGISTRGITTTMFAKAQLTGSEQLASEAEAEATS